MVGAYKNGTGKSVLAITRFIEKTFKEVLGEEIIGQVIHKIEQTHERFLTEFPPYIRDEEYNRLNAYKKQKRQKTK